MLPINLKGLNMLPINLKGLNMLPINLKGLNMLLIYPKGLNMLLINLKGLNMLLINLKGLKKWSALTVSGVPDASTVHHVGCPVCSRGGVGGFTLRQVGHRMVPVTLLCKTARQ